MLIIELDDDDIIVGDEKATVANLAAGVAMNTASVFNDKDFMIDSRYILIDLFSSTDAEVEMTMIPICEMNVIQIQ